MMNNEINIKFMTTDAINTLKNDIKKNDAKKVNALIQSNKENSNWLEDFCGCQIFEDRKNKIPSFSLKLASDDNKNQIEYDNAIVLYESLNKLPRYVLTDERFWAWLNFDIGYKYALQSMPITSKSTVGDHYLFTQGNRRGVFFGVLSRLYFRVDLTVDDSLTDKYELTKFIFENPERFRNLTWRSSSNEKHIVHGIIRAEKDICEKYESAVKNSLYAEIAKYVSLYCSVRLIDAISEQDIYGVVYKYMEEKINN